VALVSPLPVAGHVTRTTVEEVVVGEAGAEDSVLATIDCYDKGLGRS